MRKFAPPLVLTLTAWAATACTQDSQTLAFEASPPEVARQTIGPSGGLISHPSGLSVRFPPGALSEPVQVTAFVGLDPRDFPGDPEGRLIAGTYFNLVPAGLELVRPAEIAMSVAPGSILPEDRVRVGFATGGLGAPVNTEGVNFDLTSSILRGTLDELGAVVAVVSDNSVAVEEDTPPTLLGGTFEVPIGAPARASASGGSASTFTVRCSHTGAVKRCFRSGTIRVWASAEIQSRLSNDMVVLNPDVEGSLEFTDFVNGLPTRASGRLVVTGTLRVQLGQAITSFEVSDSYFTNGTGGSSSATVEGNRITLHQTSAGERSLEYEVRPTGTGEQLIVRGEETVDFENGDGTTTTATLFIDLRLRR